MPDQYYTHDNVQSARKNPNVVLVSSLYTKAPGAGGTTHAREGVELVTTGSAFSPYVPPSRRAKDNPDRLLCSHEGCKAYPMKDLEYCTGHARSMGLIENWNRSGREDAESERHDA